MLRGVHKNIIEIVETDNQYFEKAILFVRQGQRNAESELLQGKAAEYVAGIQPSAPQSGGVQVKNKPLLARTWVRLALGVLLVAAAGFLFF